VRLYFVSKDGDIMDFVTRGIAGQYQSDSTLIKIAVCLFVCLSNALDQDSTCEKFDV